MKKTIHLFCFLIVGLSGSVAQPSSFLKSYINGNCGYAVREINGNSYVVAGGTDYYYNFHWSIMSPIGNTNIHLFKTTSDGTLLWEKIFQRPLHRTIATWEEATEDGGMILCGRSNQDQQWPPDSNDVILIKCDIDGNIQWAKKFDSGKDELGFCVRNTFDGGFAISAFHDASPMSLSGTTYAMLIKTDSAGNLEWERSYEFAVRDLDTGEGLTWVFNQTSDSGYVMTGTTVGAHQADLYVIRLNSVADVLWAKSYEHDMTVNRFSLGLDILESSNKEIIIAGSMDKNHSMNELNHPYILKLDSLGNFIDAAIYTSIPPQSFQSGFSSVEQNTDGGYLFTGMGGYGGFGDQAQILKTDADFNMLWSRSYTWDGIATMGSRSGRSTSDGSFIFTGKKQLAGTVLLKTDNIGLVPCKNPDVLVEITPSLQIVDRYPSFISSVSAADILFNSTLSSLDTSTICPVTISHLPVELLYFKARKTEGKNVLLEWETASEINNDYFIVEKSLDGTTFFKLGLVNGNGTSSQMIYYSYYDKLNDSKEPVYYRLKQVDYDGKQTFSKTIALETQSMTFQLLHINNNYAENKISLSFESGKTEIINCRLIDVMGRMVFNNDILANPGINEFNIDTKTFSHGLYFYTFNRGNNHLSGKIYY
ncbi:MAG TPA: hypothetical protein PKM97_09565 [Bacteroidia bacterium]|nr:hypothetical protein [Bacteroidia bacterium]